MLTNTPDPVEIQISEDGSRVDVRPVREDYLRLAQHPAYASSSLVQNAASASRLIVTGSTHLGNILNAGAEQFQARTKPIARPLTFGPATHERVRKVHSATSAGARISSKTVGSTTKYMQNFAAKMAGHKQKPAEGEVKYDKDGKVIPAAKPGFLNKSLIAFSTIADGIAESGKSLLTSSGAAASTMVGHRYGEEAGGIAEQLAGGFKNVGLVYIDVTGVSRRAVIKSVAKGTVIGYTKDKRQVIVGGGDGGAIPQSDIQRAAGEPGVRNEVGGPGRVQASEVDYGAASRPVHGYSSEVGEPLGSSEKGRYV